MRKRLGPIPAKYTPVGAELGLAAQGARGIEDFSETDKESWSDYAQIYNGLGTAADVFKVGYSNALKTLFEMAETNAEAVEDKFVWNGGKGFIDLDLLPEIGGEIVKPGHPKIMLNRSLGTPASEGSHTGLSFPSFGVTQGGKSCGRLPRL